MVEIIDWLELATDITPQGKRVRERYKMTDNTWKVWYRPDCNIETAYSFLKYWEQTKDIKYLQLARDIYSSIVKLQKVDGSFPFAHTGETAIFTNDNAEVPIFLFRMAGVDKEMAGTYINTALKCTDFLLNIQFESGAWRIVNTTSGQSETAMFTAHAISALSTAYEFTQKKEQYRVAIEKALSWLNTQILEDGRIIVCSEVNSKEEWWRPPSSDQSICVRAYAHAEYFLKDNPNVSIWKSNRLRLISWLDKLKHESGAFINGLGEGINGADVQFITDHVYSTAFCIEAYWWSYKVDNNPIYLETAEKALNFCKGNIFYSDKAETNGVLRGAYNLKDNNFDTSSVTQNGSEEGGGNMIYTGWTNAPIVALFFEIESIETSMLSIYHNSKTLDIPLSNVEPKNTHIRIFLNGKKNYIKLVDCNDVNASNIYLYVDGKVKALVNN